MDDDALRRLAQLARLALDEDDEAARAAQRADLEAILGMVERMRRIDVDGVEPLAHPVDAAARLRTDAVTETDRRDEYQAGAPEVRDGFFVVPRVIE